MMGYTAESLIHAPVLLPANIIAAIDAWYAERGQAVASQFAPDSQYRPAPAGLGGIIVRGCAEAERAAARPVNPVLVAAQIAHESAYWQSAIVRAKNNPSGLGAVNAAPMEGAVTFASPEIGITATLAHLLTYTMGRANPWWSLDPRATAVPAGNLGVVRTLRDLEQRWAYSEPAVYAVTPPERRYGARIAALANDLTAYAERMGSMPTDDAVAIWQPSSNYTQGREGATIDLIVIHTTEGAYAGALSWLRGANAGSSNRQSSAHYLASADGSQVAQLVREADASWAAGNYAYNLRAINIEQEGYAAAGGFSDGLYATVGALVGRIAARHGIPLDRQHVIAHAEVPDPDHPGRFGGVGNHTDPGPHYDWERLLAIARGGATPAPPATPDNRYFPETGHWISSGFKAFWEANGGLAIFGYPLSEEFDCDGVTVQYFERARFEYRPDIAGNPYGVVLGLVGTAAAEAIRDQYADAFARRERAA